MRPSRQGLPEGKSLRAVASAPCRGNHAHVKAPPLLSIAGLFALAVSTAACSLVPGYAVNAPILHMVFGTMGGEAPADEVFGERIVAAEGFGIGLEEAHRMRVEGGNDGGTTLGARPVDGFARHRLVAEVEPVKIAERDDCPAKAFGQRVAMVEEPHSVAGSPIRR